MTDYLQAHAVFAKSQAARRRGIRAAEPVVIAGQASPAALEYIELLAAGRRFFWHPITPVAKPRQTRRDKWQKRPCVMAYRSFVDSCRADNVLLPDTGGTVVFCLRMPPGWSKKRRAGMEGEFHRQTPDADNLLKALMDAARKQDSGIAAISVHKIWAAVAGFAIIWPEIEIAAKAARETI